MVYEVTERAVKAIGSEVLLAVLELALGGAVYSGGLDGLWVAGDPVGEVRDGGENVVGLGIELCGELAVNRAVEGKVAVVGEETGIAGERLEGGLELLEVVGEMVLRIELRLGLGLLALLRVCAGTVLSHADGERVSGWLGL